jgi:hypothetical protein
MPVMIIPAADAIPVLDVMPVVHPLAWREWMTTGRHSGTRAARRRQWRSEIIQRLPKVS